MTVLNVNLLNNQETIVDSGGYQDGTLISVKLASNATLVAHDVDVTVANLTIVGAQAVSNVTFAAENGGNLTVDQGLLKVSLLSSMRFEARDDGTVRLDASTLQLGATETLLNGITVGYTGAHHAGHFIYSPPAVSLLGLSPQVITVDGMDAKDSFTIIGRSNFSLQSNSTLWSPQASYHGGHLHLQSTGVLLVSDTIVVRIPMTQAEANLFYAAPSTYLGSGKFTFPGTLPDGVVSGTAGNDLIDIDYLGDPEGDRVDGGDGLDLSRDRDVDLIKAGGGNDTVHAGRADDEVFGGSGDDRLYGAAGNDRLLGEAGQDQLFGGLGRDSLFGGAGDDTLSGEEGDDLLYGDAGADTLYGGAGNDSLFGGEGGDPPRADQLYGGTGADHFANFGGSDVIRDFDVNTGMGDGVRGNNDFADLSQHYNWNSLAVWNAAHPDHQFANPIGWMRADLRDNAVLDGAGSLRIEAGGGVSVAPEALNAENTGVVCFATGSLVMTFEGPCPIETLVPGALILTRDNGYQPLRWIGVQLVAAAAIARHQGLAPIRIAAGALGYDLPARDLILTRQHRVLMVDVGQEVLVPAKDLLTLSGVEQLQAARAQEYWHLLLDQHEVVMVEQAACESLHLGPMVHQLLPRKSLSEIRAVVPRLFDTLHPLARPELRGAKAQRLLRRRQVNSTGQHSENNDLKSTPALQERFFSLPSQ